MRPETVKIEVSKWTPVPEHRIETLAPLIPAPAATPTECVVRFMPEAYAALEVAQKDRAKLRELMKTPPKETDPEDG